MRFCYKALHTSTAHSTKVTTTLMGLALLTLPLGAAQAEQPGMSASSEATPNVIQKEMLRIFEPFQSLQVYLDSASAFEADKNEREIKSILGSLQEHFEHLRKDTPTYRKQLGFDMNVKLVSELLRDSIDRFESGRKSYAWWRLKKLPTQCISCHSTYKVDVQFSPEPIEAMPISGLAKAKFLLATRQYGPAKSQLLRVLDQTEDRLEASEALRKLLILLVRTKTPEAEAISLLEQVTAKAQLPEDEFAEVKNWIAELKYLAASVSQQPSSLDSAEQEIRRGINRDPRQDFDRNAVALLVGTGRIHQLVESSSLKGDEYARALYLLGLAYSELPLFFVNDWPELYLEQCIEQYPGSLSAQASYRLYRELVTQDFSGISGTRIPEDVVRHLDRLRTKAYSSASYSTQQARLAVGNGTR